MRILILFAILSTISQSCSRFLEIASPKDQVVPSEIFSNDGTATSALTGIYSRMSATGSYGGGDYSIATMGGLTADELVGYSANFEVFFNNEIPSDNQFINVCWTESFSYIYTANAILEGLKEANGVSAGVRTQLEGEAKFLRAFCYFYLVNLFGEVPLNLTTDYRINQVSRRASEEDIYAQIISDLRDAEALLNEKYETGQRTRPNKAVAKALLARVYLFTEQWELAITKASEIIENADVYELSPDLDQVFLKSSREAIWQLVPSEGQNTREGALFVLISIPTKVSLSSSLLPEFEANDARREKWVGEFSDDTRSFYYPYKYKIRMTTSGVIDEFSMVLRLAEQYLIRAESFAWLGQTDSATEDINTIRLRAGLKLPLIGLSQEQCLAEIEKQRRLELFCEWGHRWLDLKRTGKADQVLLPVKGEGWQGTDILYPIPNVEVIRNRNITQNPGYSN